MSAFKDFRCIRHAQLVAAALDRLPMKWATLKTKEPIPMPTEMERDIKLRIKKMLDKLGIDNWRMQAGGYRGRTRGLPAGTPDILAAPRLKCGAGCCPPPQDPEEYAFWEMRHCQNEQATFLWIETKAPKGKPSDEQLVFADRVRKKGHHWIIARCEDDVLKWIQENRAR